MGGARQQWDPVCCAGRAGNLTVLQRRARSLFQTPVTETGELMSTYDAASGTSGRVLVLARARAPSPSTSTSTSTSTRLVLVLVLVLVLELALVLVLE